MECLRDSPLLLLLLLPCRQCLDIVEFEFYSGRP